MSAPGLSSPAALQGRAGLRESQSTPGAKDLTGGNRDNGEMIQQKQTRKTKNFLRSPRFLLLNSVTSVSSCLNPAQKSHHRPRKNNLRPGKRFSCATESDDSARKSFHRAQKSR